MKMRARGGDPPGDAQEAKDLIAWFRWNVPEPRYHVTYMGGTPSRWATLTADSRTEAP